MRLIGLDVGTTGCKAVVFDPEGLILGYGFREYGIMTQEPGMAEQDAEEVWRITCEVIRQALSQAGSEPVTALSLSVQGDAVIPVDREFRPLYSAVLGMDYRSQPQAQRIGELHGERALFERTGMRPHPLNSLAKILWLKERRPDVYARAWKITTYADFILGRLGAEPVIDLTMASRTMAYDLHERSWSRPILESLGIDRELLSRPEPSGTVAGRVSPGASEQTGLPAGLALITGAHDQVCAALGAGVTDQGLGVVSTGTAEVLSTAFRRPALNQAMFDSFYPCYLYGKEGMYFTFALNHVGGMLLRWYRDTFGLPEVQEAEEQGTDPYDRILSKVPPEPSGLFVLPHFNGSGNPWCDMSSRGAILGLTLANTRHDLVRAILESQSYELRINLETLEGAGIRVDELRAVGGGARSPLWLQIKADILDRPIRTLRVREAACLGAAILAGAATGVYSSVDEGVKRTVGVGELYAPDPARSPDYARRYGLYREVYPAVSSIHRRMP